MVTILSGIWRFGSTLPEGPGCRRALGFRGALREELGVLNHTPDAGLWDDSLACLERRLRLLVRANINAPKAPRTLKKMR